MGSTRWVILIGDHAIKIARLRPVRPFVRMMQLLKTGKVLDQLDTYDENRFKAILKYVGAGIYANRLEFLRSKGRDRGLLVPTRRVFFCGLILIQKRGEAVSVNNKEMERHPLWDQVLAESVSVTKARAQFCVVDGCVKLADYGGANLPIELPP